MRTMLEYFWKHIAASQLLLIYLILLRYIWLRQEAILCLCLSTRVLPVAQGRAMLASRNEAEV